MKVVGFEIHAHCEGYEIKMKTRIPVTLRFVFICVRALITPTSSSDVLPCNKAKRGEDAKMNMKVKISKNT